METLIPDFSYSLVFWNAILLISIVFWIYALLNLLKSKLEKDDKIIWLLVILFIPIIGSLYYVFIGKKEI
ncbi:PLDc N-terminal domain-containing protein [Polaribacter gangjinensis]|uniref:Cardiolipin synthase N-terminal domain-containing protein n=1 Tax=Polaribacter gangjinensis TaxID=574710 RepID=A0A2S7WD14_9FLAO|nr:PLD nuclease N-terminal domain-containing protein [Polaribacter gangjinensis]PQJ75518.1 hypothetical protein BTO13_09885 [Polaribacter gangjinensis]